MRIVLIDNNPADRALIAREIRTEFPDAEGIEVARPEAFAAALADGDIDLVITDYGLGWSDGLAVMRAVRAHLPSCPIIMFSATGNEEIAVEALKAGLDDYIVKRPERLGQLRASIRGALDRRNRQGALDRAEARYQSLFAKVPVALCVCSADGTFLDANRAFNTMLGIEGGADLRARTMPEVIGADSFEAARTRRSSNIETAFRRADGTMLWVLVSARPLEDGLGVVECGLIDITPQKRLESDLKTALEQKNVLLREVYHRVYNNLQTVLSLLSMQALQIRDAEVARSFQDLNNRIQSLALVQQKLYRSRDFSSIDLGNYLQDLTEKLFGLHQPSGIALALELDSLHVPIDCAVPLGLIANELIGNALRHAFPTGHSGTIRVRLRADEPERGVMSIADDGIGVDTGVFPNGSSLGMQLVRGLARQAGAEITVASENGTEISVRFTNA